MKWIFNYQFFLFDFDGLLVNTEELHYKAYQQMCARRGFKLEWEWKRYAQAAMYESTGLKDAIYHSFPLLQQQEPKWEVLYQEKKSAYLNLLQQGVVQLMPGVRELLSALAKACIKCCVVTHAPLEQVSIIRHQQPLLNVIPHWITRNDYIQPKPHPECYQKAIAYYAKPGEKIIGFEDSPRGLQALLQTEVEGIFVSSYFQREEVAPLMPRSFRQVFSLQEL